MVWTAPRVWSTGELVTAAMMNQYVSDELSYLHGDAGTVNFNSPLTRQGNTVWDRANDGVGSGLDADLLQGFTPGHASGQVAVADGTLVTNLNAQMLNGTLESALAEIASGRVFTSGPYTSDWFRNSASGQGIYNIVSGRGGYFGASGLVDYPNGYTYWHSNNLAIGSGPGSGVVGLTETQTIANKTLSDPTLIQGISYVGTATQTLPAVASSNGRFRFFKALGGSLTINRTGSDAVYGPGGTAGVGSIVLNNGESVTAFCDGTQWVVY